MYIENIISELNKHRTRYNNCDYFIASKVEKILRSVANECIRWSVEDFEAVAERKKGEDWEEWYDSERFEEALHAMINKHDAECGINWVTVDCYLEEYCRKKDKPIGKIGYK